LAAAATVVAAAAATVAATTLAVAMVMVGVARADKGVMAAVVVPGLVGAAAGEAMALMKMVMEGRMM